MNDHKLDDRSTYGIYRPLAPHRQLAFRVVKEEGLRKLERLREPGKLGELEEIKNHAVRIRSQFWEKDTLVGQVLKEKLIEDALGNLAKPEVKRSDKQEIKPVLKIGRAPSEVQTDLTQARKTLEALQKAGVAEKDINVLIERALEAKVADPELRQEMMVALKEKQELRIRKLAGEEGEELEDEEKIHEEQEHITKEEEVEEKIYYVRDEQTSYNRALAGENAIREVYRHLGKIDCRLAATLISDSLVSAILVDQPSRFDGSLAALKEKFAATDNITNPEEAVMLFNRLNYNLPPVAESYEPRNIVSTLAIARVRNNRKAQIMSREPSFDTRVFMG